LVKIILEGEGEVKFVQMKRSTLLHLEIMEKERKNTEIFKNLL
jgi:hypothetical protein